MFNRITFPRIKLYPAGFRGLLEVRKHLTVFEEHNQFFLRNKDKKIIALIPISKALQHWLASRGF